MDAMPEIERIIITPLSTDTLMTQRVVNNEIYWWPRLACAHHPRDSGTEPGDDHPHGP